MPDSASKTTSENLSRQGAQPGAHPAPTSRPRPDDARSLADLAHEEWCELCDDLERWLDGEGSPGQSAAP